MFTLITKIATLKIRLAYPAAEPEAPESDMVLCWYSRHAWCSAGMLQWRPRLAPTSGRRRGCRRELVRLAPTSEAERSRVEASSRAATDTSKNVIANFHPRRRTLGQQHFGDLLFRCSCAQESEQEKLSKQQKRWIYLAQKLKPFLCKYRRRLLYCGQQQPRRRKIKRQKNSPTEETSVTMFENFRNSRI